MGSAADRGGEVGPTAIQARPHRRTSSDLFYFQLSSSFLLLKCSSIIYILVHLLEDSTATKGNYSMTFHLLGGK